METGHATPTFFKRRKKNSARFEFGEKKKNPSFMCPDNLTFFCGCYVARLIDCKCAMLPDKFCSSLNGALSSVDGVTGPG